jgi:hypothetical protein
MYIKGMYNKLFILNEISQIHLPFSQILMPLAKLREKKLRQSQTFLQSLNNDRGQFVLFFKVLTPLHFHELSVRTLESF